MSRCRDQDCSVLLEFGPNYAQWNDAAKVEFLERRLAQLARQLVRLEALADNQRHLLKTICNDREAMLIELQARNDEHDRINGELTESRAQLDQKVRERTEELKEKNAQLEQHAGELEKINTTLDVLIKKNNQKREALTKAILNQQQSVLGPLLDRLLLLVNDTEQLVLIEQIKQELQQPPDFSQIKQSQEVKSLCANLTSRELCIARYVAKGKNYREISNATGLRQRSVETCCYRIRKKFNLSRTVNLKEFLATIGLLRGM